MEHGAVETSGQEGNHENHAEESYWPAIVALSIGLFISGIITLLKGLEITIGILLILLFTTLLVLFIYKEIKAWPVVSSMSTSRMKLGGIKKEPHVVGGVGLPVALFLFTECMLFIGAFAMYFVLRSKFAVWPPIDAPHLDEMIPTVQTGVLILSSIMIEWAQSSVKKGNQLQMKIGCIGTTVLGAIFIILQFGVEWPHLLFDGILTPEKSFFGASFFILTGTHGVHVTGGVAALAVVSIRAMMGQFSAKSHGFLEAVSMYWHFVLIVWLFLFALIWQGGLTFS